MIKIILVEDHQVVRQGLRALLDAEPDFSVVAEASSGIGVADLVERTSPDVLIVDLMMPGLNGLEVTRQVCQRSPDTHVIVLSMHANEAYVLQALSNGAVGYVLKDSSAEDLKQAIRAVIAGRHYLSPPLSERAIEIYLQKSQAATLDPFDDLTAREREVMQLAAEGYSNPDIATALSISPRTAEVHRRNLMQKLGLRNQTELIRFAIKHGLLSVDS